MEKLRNPYGWFFSIFLRKVLQWVKLKLWNHWYPLHNLIPSLRCPKPRNLCIFTTLCTIFRGRSSWQMDVVDRVPLTFNQNPLSRSCIHHLGTGCGQGLLMLPVILVQDIWIVLFSPTCKNGSRVHVKPSGGWIPRSNSSLRSQECRCCWHKVNDTIRCLTSRGGPCPMNTSCVSHRQPW